MRRVKYLETRIVTRVSQNVLTSMGALMLQQKTVNVLSNLELEIGQ